MIKKEVLEQLEEIQKKINKDFNTFEKFELDKYYEKLDKKED